MPSLYRAVVRVFGSNLSETLRLLQDVLPDVDTVVYGWWGWCWEDAWLTEEVWEQCWEIFPLQMFERGNLPDLDCESDEGSLWEVIYLNMDRIISLLRQILKKVYTKKGAARYLTRYLALYAVFFLLTRVSLRVCDIIAPLLRLKKRRSK